MPKTTDFSSGRELCALCQAQGTTIAALMLQREAALSEQPIESIRAHMRDTLGVMQHAVDKGLAERQKSVSGMVQGDAVTLMEYAQTGKPLSSPAVAEAVAASMAVVEVNAAMGRIVAAPTAGASGILPGALITAARQQGFDEEAQVDALFTAAAVGYLISRNATVSGAEGGCQAETGSAAAMAAAALVEMRGGGPEAALSAAAMALMNVLGLVCDPVAGLVECPCIKRNALGCVNALISADMALAGIGSIIPFDEVVDTMLRVGRVMPPSLRETAQGGIAATPTAKEIAQRVWNT